jgi:hypothetical protein
MMHTIIPVAATRDIESAIIAYFSNRLIAGTENDVKNKVVYDEPSDCILQFQIFPKLEYAKVYSPTKE